MHGMALKKQPVTNAQPWFRFCLFLEAACMRWMEDSLRTSPGLTGASVVVTTLWGSIASVSDMIDSAVGPPQVADPNYGAVGRGALYPNYLF